MLPLAVLFGGHSLGSAQIVVPNKKAPKFDHKRDASADLQTAIKIATKSKKRILLDIGGEWCGWCKKLDAFFETNKPVNAYLHKNFVVVKVNYSQENKNEKLLSAYPSAEGYPHLYVLDSAGKFLHSQGTGELETGDHHDADKVMKFLKAGSGS